MTEFDIDNSVWDSEEKEYIFKKYNDYIETHKKELHFIIDFNYENNNINIKSYCNNEEIELNQTSKIKTIELENIERNNND